MKFNAKILKSKWVFYALGAIILFAVFYRLASGSGSSASTTATTSTGVSDAQYAAQLQAQLQGASINASLSAANMQAQRDIAVATLQANSADNTTQAYADTQKYLAATQAGTDAATIAANLAATRVQSEYGLADAEVASQTQLGLKQIDANQFIAQVQSNNDITKTQLATNAYMFGASLDAQTTQFTAQLQAASDQQKYSAISSILSNAGEHELPYILGRNDKAGITGTNIAQLFAGQTYTPPVTHAPNSSGGGGFLGLGSIGNIVSPITSLF